MRIYNPRMNLKKDVKLKYYISPLNYKYYSFALEGRYRTLFLNFYFFTILEVLCKQDNEFQISPFYYF